MKHLYYLSFLFQLLFTSCITLNVEMPAHPTGWKSEYENLTPIQKSTIVFTSQERAIETMFNKDTIYAITGKQLAHFIKQNEKQILLNIWQARACGVNGCTPMEAEQIFATENNMLFFPIAEFLDMEMINIHYMKSFDTPLFAINTEYYKTDRTNSYTKKFLKELMDELDQDFHFRRGQYLQTEHYIFKNGKMVQIKIIEEERFTIKNVK